MRGSSSTSATRTVSRRRSPRGSERSIPRAEAAVVLLADQPGIGARHVRSLVNAFETDRRWRSCGSGSATAPGPAILARSVWDDAMRLTGDVGARALIEAEPDRVRWLDVEEDAPPDVDRRADLERA